MGWVGTYWHAGVFGGLLQEGDRVRELGNYIVVVVAVAVAAAVVVVIVVIVVVVVVIAIVT
jgi:hypothetical protein